MVLPGCWLVLLGPIRALPLPARLSLALIMSPVVVAAEFYALRLMGLSFQTTAAVLPLLNLPAGWPLLQELRALRRPSAGTLLLWTATLALPVAYLWLWMHDPAVRANWGHAWSHADIVYMIANGQLRPEDPHLAGLRLAYPWTGHVHYAVTAWLLGSSPNVAYLWVNAGVLAGAIGAIAALTKELGGGRLARATSALWLCFGINLVGVVWWVVPETVLNRFPRVWGDGRFTPWLRKFGVFEPTVFGIALCVGLLYVVARPSQGRMSWLTAGLAGLLLLALGVSYPVLLPAGVGIIGARIAASTIVPWAIARYRRLAPVALSANMREAVSMLLTCVVALSVSALYLRMVTADRGPGSPVGLSTLYSAKEKAVTVVLVLLPLALGVTLAARQALRYPVEWVTLLGAAGVCSILYVVFDVYPDANEYKYLFAAAAGLVPLAALGFATLPDRWGRPGIAAVAMIALVLAAPGFYRRYTEIQTATAAPALVDSDRFEFRLRSGERYASALEAVQRKSPPSAILLTRRGDIDLTTVSGRATLVPADSGVVHGFGQQADHLLKSIRGYPADVVDRRRRLLFTILDSSDASGAHALDGVLHELRRPLVLLLDNTDSKIMAWLPSRRDAVLLFWGQGLQAWLVSPPPGGASK